jgi:mercuric ion transport protein
MADPRALFDFLVPRLSESTVWTPNHSSNNPLDSRAGCTQEATGCRRRKCCIGQFLSQRSGGRMPTGAKEPTDHRSASKGTVFASLAALGSAILASSCCLPLLPFLFAAGAAGTSAFFVRIRPFLVAASLAFVAFGFYQAWRAKECSRRPSVVSTILLWVSAIVVVAFTFFPQVMANLVANLLAG